MPIIFFLLNSLLLVSSYVTAYRYSKQAHLAELWITTFLLYTAQITVTLLFLGVVARNLGVVPILVLNSAIALLVLVLFRKTTRAALDDCWQRCGSSVGELVKSRDYILYGLLLLFVMQVVFIVVKIYYFPPDVWDVFAYHLHPVVEWFQQNMIPAVIDTPVSRLNRNPMGPKLLSFWFVTFSGDMTWVELPQFFYGLMTCLSAYVLMVKMKVRKYMALRYAIVLYFIPAIIIESRTVQDHLALNGLIFMAALYFINVFYEKNNAHIVFLGLTMGMLIGAKISGLQILVVFFLALFFSLGFSFSKTRAFIKKNWLRCLGGAIALVVLGGYWYLKDILIIRSYFRVVQELPLLKYLAMACLGLIVVLLFFFGVRMFLSKKGAMLWTGFKNGLRNKKVVYIGVFLLGMILLVGVVKNAGLFKTFVLSQQNPAKYVTDAALRAEYPVLKLAGHRFVKNLLLFPYRIKDLGMYNEYTPDFLDQSGFGVQFFALGVLAYLIMTVLFLLRQNYRRSIGGFLYIFSMLLLGTYFIYYYSVANYRLFMFFPVFGIMLWAVLTSRLHFYRYQLKFLDLLMVGMILFSIAVTFFEGHGDGRRWKNMFTMTDAGERTSIKYSTFFTGEDWKFMDNYIKPAEPMGYLGHFDSWVSPYFDNGMKRRIYHLSSLAGFSLVQRNERKSQLILTPLFKESLKQRKIHFLHINPQGVRNRLELKKRKSIFIEDAEVCRVTANLYYFKWE